VSSRRELVVVSGRDATMFDSAFRVFSFYAEFSRDFESLGTAFAYKAAGSGREN